MGLRFRKSFKIAPGVKINLGKKSVGMSIGGKYGGMSFNSRSGSRVRASIPGTGLSYSTKLSSGRRKSAAKRDYKPTTTKPVCLRWWYILLIILFAMSGIGNLTTNTGAAIASIAIAVIMGCCALKTVKGSESAKLSSGILTTTNNNKESLLELQKLVVEGSPDELIYSEAQLKAIAAEKAENSHRIMDDSSKLLQTSTNPEVFFERLQLFETHCQVLVSLEKYISYSGASPTEIYNTLIREKQDVVKEFLIRYYNKVLDKADSLKTAKGKLNQYQKFYDSLKPYFPEMDADNIDYIETKYKSYTSLLEMKA